MSKPRRQQISLSDTRYYHCISRCIRQIFLLDENNEFSKKANSKKNNSPENAAIYNNKQNNERRNWIVTQAKKLATIFSIDIAAYAIMHNHYHIILKVDAETALALSPTEVIEQWQLLHKLPARVERLYQKGLVEKSGLNKFEKEQLDGWVETYRKRLYSISWFMKSLNQYIARRANKEDGVKGHLFEGKFKCQPLLDEGSILTCMSYVDLNPIRAKIAETSENSDFTSIQERIFEKQGKPISHNIEDDEDDPLKHIKPARLLPFAGAPHSDNNPKHIQAELVSYISLVEWTGRQHHEGKRGKIDGELPDILKRLNINKDNWLDLLLYKEPYGFKGNCNKAFGASDNIESYNKHTYCRTKQGVKAASKFYAVPSGLS